MDHLAPLPERGLDQAPEAVLVLGRQPVVEVERLDHDHRRVDGRGRLEGRRRDRERDPDTGVVLHEHGQVAHLPGRGGDPLRDLALDHQHEPARPRGGTQEGMQDRARDVVRQVGDDVVRRPDQVEQVLVEGIALDEAQAALVERHLEALA